MAAGLMRAMLSAKHLASLRLGCPSAPGASCRVDNLSNTNHAAPCPQHRRRLREILMT